MTFKIILLCASALFVQTISGQCVRNAAIGADGFGLGGVGLAGTGLSRAGLAGVGLAGVGLAGDGIGLAGQGLALNAGYGGAAIGARLGGDLGIPTSGGGLTVTSISPIAPTGLSVVSDNTIEGVLAITGKLPFLSVVTLDGAIPTAGSGGISYGCGEGNIGIESILGADIGYANGATSGVGLGAAGLGYGLGAAGYGLGAADLRVGAPAISIGAPAIGFSGSAIGLGADVGLGRGCGCGRTFY